MSHPSGLRLGLVVTTIGRPALRDLLDSAAALRTRPVAVVVADQSRGALRLDVTGLPFPVVVVPSSGGASAGRNDGCAALPVPVDVLGFPNDDSTYADGDLFDEVLSTFAGPLRPVAVACGLQDPTGARFAMPSPGTLLDVGTVWRAIEPATFVRADAFRAAGGFQPSLGTGAPSPWQSGEITDLLLRLMRDGGRVVSRSDLAVHGHGERRSLDERSFVRKHRAYARGTGYVYRIHPFPLRARLRTLAGPLVQGLRHADDPVLSLRIALARTVGRLEGLVGRPLGARDLSAPTGRRPR